MGRGLIYPDNKDMKDFHNAYHPNMVGFLGEAILVYAQRKMKTTSINTPSVDEARKRGLIACRPNTGAQIVRQPSAIS